MRTLKDSWGGRTDQTRHKCVPGVVGISIKIPFFFRNERKLDHGSGPFLCSITMIAVRGKKSSGKTGLVQERGGGFSDRIESDYKTHINSQVRG